MCDRHSIDDVVQARDELLSRRSFGSRSVGAGLASLFVAACLAPGERIPAAPSAAVATTLSEVRIPMADGIGDAYFARPTKGIAPGVLIWPDIFGLRPAYAQIAARLAGSGYAVLVVNPFYRAPSPPRNFDELMDLARSLTAEEQTSDSKAFAAWLDQQPSVATSRRMGTIGYCMGGPPALRTAAASPGRVGAAATFHGSRLVTDAQDSPHLLIPKMKAELLIAIAADDDAEEPDVKTTLEDACARAALRAKVDVYAGAVHGWCVPGSNRYNRTAAEKAWGELLMLFKGALA
jgi:carboxymethylenebutenolidase